MICVKLPSRSIRCEVLDNKKIHASWREGKEKEDQK